ncbi:MAG: hypothetical protein GTN53_09155, partial [Candidatus Aminicenantes bacterium]|nr:hypothetical protein [Candidatus Aminicenantes bacterium]NIQ66626.1 hypothetical protein [Candidatus Aminicenantes bacterium]NIT22656.1 hypothetical protein [Candidatus Aminicenantes bacterium]
RDAPYRTECNVDRFLLAVKITGDDDIAKVEKIIRDAGAEEITQFEEST